MKDLSCDELVARLPAFIVGDLTPREEQEMHFHTETCEECEVELKQSQELSRALEALSMTIEVGKQTGAPVPGLRDRILAALPRPAAYDRIDSPLGPLYLVVSRDGLCAVRYGGSEADLVTWVQQAGMEPSPDFPVVQPYVTQLRQYFAGERQAFDVPIDLSVATPFARQVLAATAHVPFGRLATYRDIAREIGKPGAVRAVGNALGSNPVPIVVPCHRIVRSDGSLGGYTGGVSFKRRLLHFEGVLLTA